MTDDQFQQLRDDFREVRDDVRQFRDDLHTIDTRLVAIETRLDAMDARITTKTSKGDVFSIVLGAFVAFAGLTGIAMTALRTFGVV